MTNLSDNLICWSALPLVVAMSLQAQPVRDQAPGEQRSPPRSERTCAGFINGVFNESHGTPAPKLLSCVEPNYPPAARDAGQQGYVGIAALIDGQGDVKSPQVQSPNPHTPALNAAALAAVREWRFTPSLDANGQPDTSRLLATVEFWKDTMLNVGTKTCADYVRDSNWFAATSPGKPRMQMHIYQVLVDKLAWDAYFQHTNLAKLSSMGGRLPAALDAAFNRCVAAPQAGFFDTIQSVLEDG